MTQLLKFPHHPSQQAPEELSAALPPRGAQHQAQACREASGRGFGQLRRWVAFCRPSRERANPSVEPEVQKVNAPLRPSACVTSRPAASCIDEICWDAQSPEPSQTPRVLQPRSSEGGQEVLWRKTAAITRAELLRISSSSTRPDACGGNSCSCSPTHTSFHKTCRKLVSLQLELAGKSSNSWSKDSTPWKGTKPESSPSPASTAPRTYNFSYRSRERLQR